MKAKLIEAGQTYLVNGRPAKVVDCGPFIATINGMGRPTVIDGIQTMTLRSPDGNRVAVRYLDRDGEPLDYIDLVTPARVRPLLPAR